MMRKGLMALALLLLPAAAHAALEVAATTSNMGMLARTVGGEHVEVRVMAPPDRDAHYLEARPSMIAALRRADLVVAVGGDLEVGWLPAAIRGANNPRVNPGEAGYFEAAAQVELIGAGAAADRGRGDVHPAGNPHVYLDPVRMGEAAEALAERLAALDDANAETYRANAEAFTEEVEARLPEWTEAAEGLPGVVLFHDDAGYLLERFDIPLLGTVERLPGIPPSAAHLRDLVRELEGREGVILRQPFHPTDGPRFLGEQLGWPVREVPHEVGVGAGPEDYFALIDAWLAAARP